MFWIPVGLQNYLFQFCNLQTHNKHDKSSKVALPCAKGQAPASTFPITKELNDHYEMCMENMQSKGNWKCIQIDIHESWVHD